MGDLLGSPRVATLFQYLFFTRPSGRGPLSRKFGSGGSGIWKGGAPWGGDGPREDSRRRRRYPRRPAYDDCVRIHWQNSAVRCAWAKVDTRMGDLLGSPRVAPLFQYLFFTRPSGRRPLSQMLGSGGSGIRKGGAPWRGDGPREASLRRRRCPRRLTYDDFVRIHRQVRSYQH
ncbi:hypothetical protein PIB30_100966 [Stylosanthes scabra]|uniref:Uncharacterized protein n=1 Tax=Stylosanthes scabra TaxID=79078 RepID=A0ABU6YV24_9FABA|nr:hypothetical protein [Stylosanthes scabra]